MGTQWTKTSDELPPMGVLVDIILSDGTQRKRHWSCADWRSAFMSAGETPADNPLYWKLPNPVADAAQELRQTCKRLVAFGDALHKAWVDLHGVAKPHEIDMQAVALESARALLDGLEPK